jgi:hypothetical protein
MRIRNNSMRVSLGTAASIALAVVALAGCGEAGPSQAQASSQEQGETITAVGCPEVGAQPSCLVMKKGGKVYDVTEAGIDMSRGVGVSVMGTAAGEVTACGTKLTDVKVDYMGIQCAAPPAY